MKKKRKYVILSYMLIYSKLMLYFFSFYNFLFFRLLAKAETYVFLVGNVSFGFGKHTFPVGETYNRQAYNFVDALELWILAF